MNMNTSIAAKGALAHRLQHLTACLIQNGRRGLEPQVVGPPEQL